MKQFMNNLFIAVIVLLNSLTYAKTGFLFNIAESGATASVDVILCLNGKGPLSCQNYHVSAVDLHISTAASHHYPEAGIKVLSPGYQATGCTPYSNGYCLFAASNSTSATIHLNSSAQKQNQTISFTSTAPSATVGGPAYTPTATATSDLPVTITVNSSSAGICSISGGMISFAAAGTCILNGNQAGNVSYNPAPQVQQSISVSSIGASLAISSPTLVLAQADIFTNASGAPVATSKSRTLTITNQGQGTATNLSIVFNPVLSGGTSVDISPSNACTSSTVLAHNDSCTVTIAPGTPSSIGSAPVINTMTVTAINASNSVISDIATLTYGSLYRGGYVFSIDDSTASSSSVGLVKVAAISDQNPQAPSVSYLPWDADPACATFPSYCTNQTNAWSTLYGQNADSVPGSNNPSNTGTNGPGNTYLISFILNGTNGNTNTAPANYAAGVCVSYNGGGYTDWYLPAMCEMGYETANGSGCGVPPNAPTLQNMQSNLIDIDNTSSVASGLFNGGRSGGTYWSSNERSDDPLRFAWGQLFSPNGSSSGQGIIGKSIPLGVRCVRGFVS